MRTLDCEKNIKHWTVCMIAGFGYVPYNERIVDETSPQGFVK